MCLCCGVGADELVLMCCVNVLRYAVVFLCCDDVPHGGGEHYVDIISNTPENA